MAETPVEKNSGKGKAFFDRAAQVAETGNWDFAIEMYVEGIQREPDNVELGLKKLREVSLKRMASGGKGPGIRDKRKNRPGKDAAENLAKACYLLGKEPGSLLYMTQGLQAARKLELAPTIKWFCDRIMEHQSQDGTKPDRKVLETLINLYEKLEEYSRAVGVCDLILRHVPDDGPINDIKPRLAAREAIQHGKYEDNDREFADNVVDIGKQQDLMEQDAMVQHREYLERQVNKARHEYEEDPTVPGKIYGLVDALMKLDDEEAIEEAIRVLDQAWQDTHAYQHKMRIGDIRMRQMKREHGVLTQAGQTEQAEKLKQEILEFELAEFTERVENYPTDLGLSYELGRRLLEAGRYDEAITELQKAQRDARKRVSAMNYLGRAFVARNMLPEASETYDRALRGSLTEDVVKVLRYNLGDVLERMGELERSQDEFSQVAQIDFNFKDVRTRLDRIREQIDKRKQRGES